jgi:pimeloyl-ACP methyl ester carboxylesterase
VTAVADDLVELLDHLGLEDVPVVGQSGGGAHVLGLCARHPERVRAATVVVGAAPLTDADLPHLVGLNAEAYRRIRTGGWSSLHALLAEQRLALLAHPLAGFRAAMQGAPDSDWAVMADPAWHDTFAQGVREALRPGAEGWADESLALLTEWDFAPEEVSTPIVWWHARHDANVPLQAVERVTARLPSVDLRVWDGRGHLESYHREQDVLADLLSR